MKRNVKSVVKLLLLSGCTVFCTVILFRRLSTTNSNISSSLNDPLPRPPNNYKEALVSVDNTKIDWHNYTFINYEKKRKGTGEQGKPAHLQTNEMSNYDALYKVNGFNAALSDKISVNRAIPDIRHPACASKKYLKNLGTVSVIVPFHNEHWTTLLRTVHSIVNRSPAQLLKEIILVDDFSSKDFSKKPLDDYMRENMTKVQVIHLPERQGLILARLAGAKAATGDVLIFLDSHAEANVNWLPPLLEPIAMDYKTCVCPFIDVVAFETFEYRAQDEGARGAFDWEFFYKRLPLLPEDLKHPSEPFKSPIMAGGLFAISRTFFWELGGYDEGLQIWGGEQYELSFKIWMCGGQMLDAPCSRVGHIYRKYSPFPNPGRGDYVGKNYRRVAEVWMDEYAQYLYNRRPHYKDIDPGDLTKQKGLRQQLKCKSFKWFIQEIAFDLPLKYPPVEPEDFAYGEIRNIATPELCVHLESESRDQVLRLEECSKNHAKKQEFKLSWHKDIRPMKSTLCWDVSDPSPKADIVLYPCHGAKGNQYFKYDAERQVIHFGGNNRCVDCDPGAKKLFVTVCDSASKTQLWRFKHVNLEAIGNWDSIN